MPPKTAKAETATTELNPVLQRLDEMSQSLARMGERLDEETNRRREAEERLTLAEDARVFWNDVPTTTAKRLDRLEEKARKDGKGAGEEIYPGLFAWCRIGNEGKSSVTLFETTFLPSNRGKGWVRRSPNKAQRLLDERDQVARFLAREGLTTIDAPESTED